MARTISFDDRAFVTDVLKKILCLTTDLIVGIIMTTLATVLVMGIIFFLVPGSREVEFDHIPGILRLMFIFATMAIAILVWRSESFGETARAVSMANFFLCFAWGIAFAVDMTIQETIGVYPSATMLIHIASYLAWFSLIYRLRYHTQLFK